MPQKYVVLLSLLLLTLILPIGLQGQETIQAPEFLALPTDQIIIQFNEAGLMRHVENVAEQQVMHALSDTVGMAVSYVRPMGLAAHHVIKLPARLPQAEVEAMAAKLTARDDVVSAQPDSIRQHFGLRQQNPNAAESSSKVYLPFISRPVTGDPLRSQQWHYDYVANSAEGINLYNAWNIYVGSPSMVVAVVDTGILNHVDLGGRILPGYDFIGDILVANDGNGRDNNPLDPGDWITAAESASGYFAGCPISDSSWHGTHVAGTIGAVNNNGIGVSGIDHQAKILPIRVLGKCGGYTSDIIDGTLWAAGIPVSGVPNNPNPAKIINLSLGGFGACTAAEQNAFTQIWNAGVVPVVAAGNSNADAANYSPGNCNNVITVAANNRSGGRAYYSNYGSVIEISGPGGAQSSPNDPNGVLSTLNSGTMGPQNDNYIFYQGTSMAAPHVAGVAALVKGQNPTMTPAQVLSRLQTTARPFPAGSTCNTSICGSGIVDAFRALGGSTPPPPPPPPPPPNPFTNPGFESGSTGWVEYSAKGWPLILNSGFPGSVTPHGGSWLAWLGGDHNETAYVQQQVTVPATGSYLFYWHWIASEDLCGYDFGAVLVNGTKVHEYDLCESTSTGGWVKKVVNLTAYSGQSVTLRVRVTTDSSLNSNLFVDDFGFQATAAAVLEEGGRGFVLPDSLKPKQTDPN